MAKSLTNHTDIELYKLLGEGNAERESAFTELYRRHSSRVWLYCQKIMGNDEEANDMFQGTFLRFLQSAGVDRTMTNVPGFLLRIARNLCLNTKQKMRPTRVPYDELQIPVEDTAIERRELAGLISTALDLLNDEQREAFVLQAYNGLSYKEIAAVIDQPVSTVRNRVVRAKKKIREILTPYLADYRE